MPRKELVVYDEREPCPYIEGEVARMPLRRPMTLLEGTDFDAALEAGDRRAGYFLYNTSCPTCSACEPIRLLVNEFKQSRSHRRVWRKGQASLRSELGPVLVDEQRLRLFNRHRELRGLGRDHTEMDAFGYEHFLVDSCCDTREVRYYHEDALVGVAILDVGDKAVSAVYTFYEPECRATSIGVYSILTQVEICRQLEINHLYLGYFVAASPPMKYKADYRPHERRINSRWVRFD